MPTKTFNIIGNFKDAALERAYGLWTMPHNRPHAYFGMALLSLTWLFFIPTDYRLHGASTTFYLLLLLRGWQVFLAITISLLIKRDDNPKLYNYLICIFWLSTLSAILIVNTTRPTEYYVHFVVDIIALLFSYMLIPNRLIYQIIPAILFTVASLNYFLFYKHIQSPNEMQLAITTYIMVNVIGIITSWRANVESRKRYLLLTDLQQTNQDLEKALAEIKTLQGIVPICSKCKKIRDDSGFWNQLEEFMETRLDAEFSHGICPDCMREIYPEVADKVLNRQEDAS
jgi:signal transduction histidine kinase